MNHILIEELYNLVSEYKGAETRADRLIKRRLDAIVNCYDECTLEEREFADEITVEFCRLISLLKEQHKKELEEAASGAFSVPVNNRNNFVSPVHTDNAHISYTCGGELLDAFYEHFKDKMVEVTLRDYVARINTFAYSEKYLGEMLSKGELGPQEISVDPVLFTYANIELIIAKFNTKDENGNSVKQKLNIRSALRKLNEFKIYIITKEN